MVTSNAGLGISDTALFNKAMGKPIDANLPDYAKLYMNHLIGKYRAHSGRPGQVSDGATPPADGSAAEVGADDKLMIKAVLKKEVSEPTWGDLLAFEIGVLRALSFEEVRRDAHTIRRRYRDVAGHLAYDEYLKSAPPDPDLEGVNEHALRADLCNLLTQINWLYASMPIREKKRNSLTKVAALIPAILLAIITASLAVSVIVDKPLSTPTYLMVLFVGAVGGAVSMQIRLQGASRGGDPIAEITTLMNGRFGFFLAPVTGAFFALVLYMVFAARLIEGTVFPHINTPESSASLGITFRTFSESTGAATGVDFAKLLVWSFIAGFAERFVPDTLNWFVDKKETVKGEKGGA